MTPDESPTEAEQARRRRTMQRLFFIGVAMMVIGVISGIILPLFEPL